MTAMHTGIQETKTRIEKDVKMTSSHSDATCGR